MALSILITRPRPAADAFAGQVRARLGAGVMVLVSPVMRIEPLADAVGDLTGAGTLVLSSAHAVAALGRAPAGMLCYCVGGATAEAARAAGFQAVAAGGSARDLVAQIVADRPPGPILHLRGEHVAADIAGRLRKAGIKAREAVVYRQTPMDLSPAAQAVLRGDAPVIVPLFSPRSARLFFAQADGWRAPLHVAAISDNAARAVPGGTAVVAERAAAPTARALLDSVEALASRINRVESGNRSNQAHPAHTAPVTRQRSEHVARKTTSAKPPAKRRDSAKDDANPVEGADTTPGKNTAAESAGAEAPAEAEQAVGTSATGDEGETAPAGADLPADEEAGAKQGGEAADVPDAGTPDAAPHDHPEDAPALPPVPTEQVTIRKGGFVPLLIGGLVAGAIGLGAGYYIGTGGLLPTMADIETLRDETSARIAAQAERIDALSERIDTAAAPDLSDLEQAVDALAGDLDRALAQLATTAERLDALEARVAEAGAPGSTGVDGAELETLREALTAQGEEIAALTARAQEADAAASATAQAKLRRAALARLQTALDTGGSLVGAVADLEAAGVGVPEVLGRGDSVASLADLQARFPGAARAALAAARAAAVDDGEGGGLTAFLRTQLGARSLEPREGDDPDAILSRAEAAARDGRLTDALAEIDALPEAARTELAGWAGDAARRLEAAAAAQKLSEELD